MTEIVKTMDNAVKVMADLEVKYLTFILEGD